MNAPVRIIARWPEMMLQKDAAEYCGLSIAAFEREVYARRLPAPVRFGGKDHWRKAAIDAALDAPWRREMKERYARKNA
jgi:predicted DNA-binding transcriptional regulator AlpA